VDGLLEGCVVTWHPFDNRIVDNVVEGSGVADIAVGTADLDGTGVTTDRLRNCFAGNTFASSMPAAIEQLAPCEGTGSGDWDANPLDLLGLLGEPAEKPPADIYKTTPEPAAQANMPDAATAPPRPATNVPPKVDVAAIQLPGR